MHYSTTHNIIEVRNDRAQRASNTSSKASEVSAATCISYIYCHVDYIESWA